MGTRVREVIWVRGRVEMNVRDYFGLEMGGEMIFIERIFLAVWDWCMIAIGSLRSRKFKNLLGMVKDENGRRRRGMEYVKIIRNYLNYFHKINILNDNFLI